MEHFEKFWEKFIFFGIPPFSLVFALSFATGMFWEKMEHFENFWEKNGTFWEILRKIRVQPELCQGPFVKNPTDLVLPFLRAWASVKNFWEKIEKTLMEFYLHTQCHWPAKNGKKWKLFLISVFV
jgi:hypothetical protein